MTNINSDHSDNASPKSKDYRSHGRTGVGTSVERANDFWKHSRTIETGCPAHLYLESRDLWPLLPGEDLRWGRRYDFHAGEDGVDAFYLAAQLSDHEGYPRAIQYLRMDREGVPLIAEDGHKDRVTIGPAKGCAVWPVAVGQPKVGIAEGLETAMAVRRLYGVPCFAALGAKFLGSWLPPVWIRELIIFADSDKPGLHAAEHLTARIAGLGAFGRPVPTVTILRPIGDNQDFADLWENRS